MPKLEKRLREAYPATTYAAKRRETSIVVCEYCKIHWTVTPKQIIDKEDRFLARTYCSICGRSQRVYAPTVRNKVMLFSRILDPIPVFLGMLAVTMWYIALFWLSLTFGWIGVTLYLIFLIVSGGVFEIVNSHHGDVPKKDGKVDYDKIREVLGEGYS